MRCVVFGREQTGGSTMIVKDEETDAEDRRRKMKKEDGDGLMIRRIIGRISLVLYSSELSGCGSIQVRLGSDGVVQDQLISRVEQLCIYGIASRRSR
jgi:hypothetical protein